MDNPQPATINDAIRELIAVSEPETLPDYDAWKHFFTALATQQSVSGLALLGGAHAPEVGYAFASGYQAALRYLCQRHPLQGIAALCVTEENGNHPRSIATSLTPAGDNTLVMNGSKTFITGGPRADILLVAAHTGESRAGRPVLKLVSLDSGARGIQITPMSPLPFVPEIEHASVTFANVAVSAEQVLPGDGYSDYIKPFRTIEDIHVSLALCGYLSRICRHCQARDLLPAWLSLSAQHLQLASLPPGDPVTHLLLAGCRQQLEQQLPSLEARWQAAEPESFAHWQRDKALLAVAGNARAKRTATALTALGLS